MPDETSVEGYYTTAEAAKYLGIAVATLKHHLTYQKDIELDTRAGHVLLFRKETLDAFQERRRAQSRPKRDQSD